MVMDGVHMQGNTCGFTLWRFSIIVWTLECPETLVVDPECLDVNICFVEVMATHSTDSNTYGGPLCWQYSRVL